jgi:hypothetical protein
VMVAVYSGWGQVWIWESYIWEELRLESP